jgi:hypothetical protein
LRLAHDLDFDALCADIVENELGAHDSLDIYPTAHSNFDILVVLAGLEGAIFLEKLAQIGVDMELVWVWVGVLAFLELLDSGGADLKVLLCWVLVTHLPALLWLRSAYIWCKIALFIFSRDFLLCLALRWGRSSSSFGGLFGFGFALLDSLLEFALAAGRLARAYSCAQ